MLCLFLFPPPFPSPAHQHLIEVKRKEWGVQEREHVGMGSPWFGTPSTAPSFSCFILHASCCWECWMWMWTHLTHISELIPSKPLKIEFFSLFSSTYENIKVKERFRWIKVPMKIVWLFQAKQVKLNPWSIFFAWSKKKKNNRNRTKKK